jgi:hypothetical protein
MAKISQISIQNFKFFRQPEIFDLGSKHLLIYGENGSGKSSLYWAIYTLLECSNKPGDEDVSKYFTPGNNSSLANLFLPLGGPEFVDSEITLNLDDGSSFRVSQGDVSIRSNNDAKAANYASEFLNYKMLFRIHDFIHNSEIDLFQYFEREVFPYVKFAPVKYWREKPDGSFEEAQTDNAREIAALVATGPPKSSFNKNGIPVFPRINDSRRATYDTAVKSFQKELEALITYINTQGNPILANDFDGDFQFRIDLIEVEPYKINDRKFRPPRFQVTLSVPMFHGAGPVPRPQSFLNEARLSVLGLAIRFAILKKRLQTAKLKLALLDDFMISLDMNNRDVALNYIFDRVAGHYQTFILTHDRYFYELAKDKLKRKGIFSGWKTYEMFEAFDDEDNPKASKPKPCLIEDMGKVNKAKVLYRSKDYASAANMIRQATEKLCRAYLTKQEMLGADYGQVSLTERVNRVITKATTAGIDPNLLNDLGAYKNSLMDLGSHHDIEAPLFKTELFRAIATLDGLKIPTGNPDL